MYGGEVSTSYTLQAEKTRAATIVREFLKGGKGRKTRFLPLVDVRQDAGHPGKECEHGDDRGVRDDDPVRHGGGGVCGSLGFCQVPMRLAD